MAELENQPLRKSPLKNPLLYSTIAALVIALYVGFIFFTRYESNRALESRNAAKAEQQRRADDLAAIQQLGGSELAIGAFYVSPALIHPGEQAQVCYDVSNAKTVTIEPPVGDVWPSHTRCLDVSPKKTTTYTLTIKDASGQSASQSVKLEVRERPPVHVKSFPSR